MKCFQQLKVVCFWWRAGSESEREAGGTNTGSRDIGARKVILLVADEEGI